MTVKNFRDKIKCVKNGNLWISNCDRVCFASPVTDICFDSKLKHCYLLSSKDSTTMLKKDVLKILFHLWGGSTISVYDIDLNESIPIESIFTEDDDWNIHFA